MRIVLATDLTALGPGGLEVLIRELTCGLSKDHTILLASADDPEDISQSRLSSHIEDFIQTPKGEPSPEWSIAFANDLRQRRVDLCHFHLAGTFGWKSGSREFSPILRVRDQGIRCLSTNHQAIHPFDLSRAGDPLWRRLGFHARTFPGKWSCLRALEHEYLVSDHDLRIARATFPMFWHKFSRIYHSCLESTPPPVDLPESKIILNLATVCYRKGQHILAAAFAGIADRHPEWRLRFVGTKAQNGCVDAIQRIARATGLEDRIELCGPTTDPVSAIREAEIYVQPSLLEGLGLSLQEAMFHGRPCIGSRVGGIPELIDHNQNGLLVPPNDPTRLAAALSSLMSDRSNRERIAIEARSAIPAKGMTKAAMLDAYEKLYATAP